MDKYISSDEDGLLDLEENLDLEEKAVRPTRCCGSRKNWLETGAYLGIDVDLLLQRLQEACHRIYGAHPEDETLCDLEAFPDIRIQSNTG
jgi:hypothetical protein